MRLSMSSIFITLIMVTLMGLLLSAILHQKKRFIFFRADLLIVLGLIILIRLLFPLEFPFTFSIYIRELMNPIQALFNFEIINGLSVFTLFCGIWGMGSLISLFIYLQKIRTSKKILENIIPIAKKSTVSALVSKESLPDHPVWITSQISTPMVFGYKEVILLPDSEFNEEELEVILSHELQHVKTHDIYIKQFMNILMILYWWFLPIYWLNRNINLALEIRADTKATKGMSEEDILNYAYTLVSIEDRIHFSKTDRSLAVSSHFLIRENASVLSYRINYLLHSSFKKKTNVIFLVLIILLPFLSNSIIFEADFGLPDAQFDYVTVEDLQNGYILHQKDGTYTLVMGETRAEIENPFTLDFQHLPIVEE